MIVDCGSNYLTRALMPTNLSNRSKICIDIHGAAGRPLWIQIFQTRFIKELVMFWNFFHIFFAFTISAKLVSVVIVLTTCVVRQKNSHCLGRTARASSFCLEDLWLFSISHTKGRFGITKAHCSKWDQPCQSYLERCDAAWWHYYGNTVSLIVRTYVHNTLIWLDRFHYCGAQGSLDVPPISYLIFFYHYFSYNSGRF